MGITKVVHLEIDQFRRFKAITVPFGEKVTLIAGQNGTSKSTLLGMLAQPLSFGVVRGRSARTPDASSYTENYHGCTLSDYVDLTGKPFMYDCDDVFRLSEQFDSGRKYRYSTKLTGVKIIANSRLQTHSLTTLSRTTSNRMRFVTGPGASHRPGEGNFPHPVIYLGLNRLWPLAVAKTCTFSGDPLPENDKRWYVEKYNEILCLAEHDNNAKFMNTTEKKKFITPVSSDYDGKSCSAGQDNLGQLLTAILSFRGLKKKLGEKYKGGMLLIDELDATLHAFAQDKLLELLCAMSKELGLQVIATTHSLRLLEKAYKSRLRRDAEVLYLSNMDGKIAIQEFSSFEELSNHLKVEATPPPTKKPRKTSVVFEDNESKHFFQQICGSKLRNYLSCANTATLGGGQLKNLATMSKALPELHDVILVPDGDMTKAWTDPPKNLLTLPGKRRPETVVYRHLFSMKDSDPFWKKCDTSYTKQVAITKQKGESVGTGDDKEWAKQWYKGQEQYWGRGNQRVFKSWTQAHKKDCLEFCKKFLQLLKRRYKGEVPQDVIDKVLMQFK